LKKLEANIDKKDMEQKKLEKKVEKDKEQGKKLENAEFKAKGAISSSEKDAIIARAIANAKK